MKRAKNKLFVLLFIIILILTQIPLTGISKDKKAPITLTVYDNLSSYYGIQEGWFAKVLLDKFNVKLKIIKDDGYVFDSRMKSGKLWDICNFASYEYDYPDAANKGLLLDWNKNKLLSKYGPYIKKNMKKALEKNASLTKSGKVYGFGWNVATSPQDHESFFYHPDIRWDLYRQLGYPEIKTLEEWVDVLAQMKKICPTSDSGKETYGVSLFTDWDGDSVMFVKSTAALYGYDELGVGLYNVNTQTWQGNLDNNSMYLRCLKFYNQLYQRDLLDPDSMTQGFDGSVEDYEDGATFFSLFNFLGSANYNTDEHIQQGKAMYACASEDQKTLAYGLNVFGGIRVCAIGAKTKYPELCMKILNWLSTPEGNMIATYGPKGLTWDYNDKKQPYLTAFGLKCMKDESTKMPDEYSGSFIDGCNKMNFNTWSINATNPDSDGETYSYNNWITYSLIDKSDIINDWMKVTGAANDYQYLNSRKHSVAIGTSFSPDVRIDKLDVTWQKVTTTIKDNTWKAIYAENDKEFENIVMEMRKKANDCGYAKCCDFCRKQAAKRKAAEDKALSK